MPHYAAFLFFRQQAEHPGQLGIQDRSHFSQPLSIAQKQNPPVLSYWGVSRESLAITYFHTGIRTIIGVESFHGPVRDGKGWFQLAMVTRHKRWPR